LKAGDRVVASGRNLHKVRFAFSISAMPSASDTAYPRLKTNPSATEPGEIYAPNIFELVFAAEHTRKPSLQVGLLLLLKTFQRLGYFVRYIDIPAAIISHIVRYAGYQDVPEG
jgi:hypothetical protein